MAFVLDKLEDMENIYEAAKKVYNREITVETAVRELMTKTEAKEASLKMYFNIYACMRKGKCYKLGTSAKFTKYLLEQIYTELGNKAFKTAVSAAKLHSEYRASVNNEQPGITKVCREVIAEKGLDLNYDNLPSFKEDKPGKPHDIGEKETACIPYTAEDFLQDVYMDAERYQTLKTLLLTKKNVILQGAPGVGKTYAAMRLAYSIMGEKDTSRVQMVQFHQSYSYEDFIMGFRPTETGFTLKKGVFYEFCRKAAEDDRPYFFIIDEINRGNLSKIFGELFMLIENDKRGVELQLLYADEQFSIPSNVHIIGMMNTADRSLAMLDYALRRRFAFFEMPPAFTSSGFQAYKAKISNIKFDRLIETVKRLNREITEDDSLGEGFRIGHSYFCTNINVSDEWLRSVVKFELIPLLKEYWFDEPSKVKDWSFALQEAVK